MVAAMLPGAGDRGRSGVGWVGGLLQAPDAHVMLARITGRVRGYRLECRESVVQGWKKARRMDARNGSLKTRDRKASNHAIGTGKSIAWRRQGDCISISSERPERRSRGRMRTGVSWRLKLAERGAQAADGCVDAASKQND